MLTDTDIAQIRTVVAEELARARRRHRPRDRARVVDPLPALAPLLEGREAVTVREAAELCAEPAKVTHALLLRIVAALDALGWAHRRLTIGGARIWRYHRPGI